MLRTPTVGFSLFCGLLAYVGPVAAQQTCLPCSLPPRMHVFLPMNSGATPLSTVIEAQAKYAAAYGDFLESVANARKTHADAYTHELENWGDEVNAYFERRADNRAWRAQENPDYLEIKKRHYDVLERRLREQLADVLYQGNWDRQLNYLLTQLAGPEFALHCRYDKEAMSRFDRQLPRDALDSLWITDGGPAGNRLEMRLTSREPMELDWPPGMRGCQFAAARTDFEAMRRQMLEEIQFQGQVSDATSQRYMTAINQLLVTLEETYPRQRRKEPSMYADYHDAKRYLQTLVAQGRRAASVTDPSAFNGSLTFQGDSVVELVRFMNDCGVQFAPARAGGEPAYRALLANLRNLHLDFAAATAADTSDPTQPVARGPQLREVNEPPILWPIEDVAMKPGEVRRIQLTARDPGQPAASLRYSLVDAPPWVSLDSATGIVTCAPQDQQADKPVYVVVRVSDSGVPPETDDKTFAIAVLPPLPAIADETDEGDDGPRPFGA